MRARYVVTAALSILLIGAPMFGLSAKTLGRQSHGDLDPSIVVAAEDWMDAMLMWRAVAEYRSAGLELPELEIQVHDDAEACGGQRGRFQTREGPDLLLVCARHANPRVEISWRFDTAMHELAHAHINATFLEDDINSFIDANELSTWMNRKATWAGRAGEVAAESLAWGLAGKEPDVRMELSCDQLLDNYRMITGEQPQSGAFDTCE